ncbi:MAG: GNAT family protein [Pseudomonadales bacterium]
MSGIDLKSGGRRTLPRSLPTRRLLLRVPTLDDAEAVNEAIRESFTELNAWMEWAALEPTLEDTRTFCLDAIRQREAGSACALLMFDAADGSLVGATGFASIDWGVPAFEIGYWCRTPLTGRGFVSEAAEALTRHAFAVLGAARVFLRMDDRNARSYAVAERLGFQLEGVLRHEVRDHHGRLRNTRVYSLLDANRIAGSLPISP